MLSSAEPAVIIRAETPADAAGVSAVVEQAFGRRSEADLVVALRRRGAALVALVAVAEQRDTQVVGHILFSPVSLDSDPALSGIVTLAPLAVQPAYQRRGIGAKLVQAGIEACRQQGCGSIVVLGHPHYYPRFGFVPAHHYGLYCDYVEPDNAAFMVLELQAGVLAGRHGRVVFLPEFDEV